MGTLRDTWKRWTGSDDESMEAKRKKKKKRREHFKKAKNIRPGGYMPQSRYEYKKALEEADDY